MKNLTSLKLVTALWTGMAIVQCPVFAEDKPAFKDDKEKASYGVGMTFGNQIKRAGFEVDADVVVSALRDVLAGQELRLTEQQARETIMAYQQEARKKTAEKNKKEGEDFLAANLKKEGIKTHTVTLPDGKTADFQYRIITEGSGAMPKSNDVVSVNYRGTLINGKEFDSSAKRGLPAELAVSRFIKGWAESLQLMKVGSKWETFIPSVLGYGDNGYGANIEPGSTLIFEVELIGIEPPQQQSTNATPAQPLTSDIIRVPSAEELKKGAKIEVIKPEEAAKAAADAAKSKTK
jgi:FKBP-type peptidyl-prolyl cis-trans isomerase